MSFTKEELAIIEQSRAAKAAVQDKAAKQAAVAESIHGKRPRTEVLAAMFEIQHPTVAKFIARGSLGTNGDPSVKATAAMFAEHFPEVYDHIAGGKTTASAILAARVIESRTDTAPATGLPKPGASGIDFFGTNKPKNRTREEVESIDAQFKPASKANGERRYQDGSVIGEGNGMDRFAKSLKLPKPSPATIGSGN